MTKNDVQKDSAKSLYTTEARLNTVIVWLEDFARDVNSNKVSRNRLKVKSKFLKETALPMLKRSSKVIYGAARDLAPIPKLSVLHHYNESKKRRKSDLK